MPKERLESVLQPIFLHLPQDTNFLRIGLEVGPDVVMDGNDDFGIQAFGHAQDVHRRHFVGDAAWILAERAQRHIDHVVVAVFGIIVGVVRIAAVI